MFCNQCEQAAKETACTKIGVCGKQPETAALQDLLIMVLQDVSCRAVAGRRQGVVDPEVDQFVRKGLFSTLTNVNFDDRRFEQLIRRGVELRERLRSSATDAAAGEICPASGDFTPAADPEGLARQGEKAAVFGSGSQDQDVLSLKQVFLYGMKGVAAYADHAAILGREDEVVDAFLQDGLMALRDLSDDREAWVRRVLKCGEINLRAMELLDEGNTGVYGHPIPTTVPLGARKGKAILVSGHDLRDLEQILRQSAGTGISVYTHGEMLPCHGYPELKKYPHFHGHYGTAWQNQAREFDEFPGAIVMTTNCIQKPRDSYKDSMFTSGLAGWPGVSHIRDHDFSPVIEKALAMDGFPEDTDRGSVMVGFARNTVLSVADRVVEGVKNGDIRHFFLVAGCDGAKPGRNYYTDFVEKVAADCVVLTLACGKFRFFDQQLGTIGDIPRLLDIGQCNDAYSAVKIATALAGAFDCGVNDLPLSFVLSWYEQKAVAILLTLFYLGIRDIRLGPSLPAFLSGNVLQLLVDTFGIRPITSPDRDLADMLGSGSEENKQTAA